MSRDSQPLPTGSVIWIALQRIRFLAEVGELLSPHGWVTLSQLRAGDRAIAWLYAFRFARHWSFYQMTFDCGFREYSPGSGLRLKVIEEACDSPETNFVDLGLGGEHHKQRWATATRQTIDVTLARSTVTYLRVAARYHAAAAIKTSPRLESYVRRVLGLAIKRDRPTMKVLLLHPQDAMAQSPAGRRWDLVVDTGRAPVASYKRWSQLAGCPVISIYDHAEEIADLYWLRQLLRLGSGRITDQWGIDWWEVLSLEIASDLQQLVLVHRLSKELDAGCELYSSRPQLLATALQRLLNVRLTILESGLRSVIRRAGHAHKLFSHLDAAQFLQVIEDKFDGEHSIRRHFTRRGHRSGQPIILLPSAYSNVSRTAVSYAELLPDHQFLLVHSRSNAKLTSLPTNVHPASLTPYFVRSEKQETASLIESWNSLRKNQLIGGAEEFNTADAVGLLELDSNASTVGHCPAERLEPGLRIRECYCLSLRR